MKIYTFSVAVMNSWVMLYMVRNSSNFNLGWRIARTPRSFAHLPWAASHAAKTASAFSRNISALFRIRLFENIKQMGQQLKHKSYGRKQTRSEMYSPFLSGSFTSSRWIKMMSPSPSFLKGGNQKCHLLSAKRNSVLDSWQPLRQQNDHWRV